MSVKQMSLWEEPGNIASPLAAWVESKPSCQEFDLPLSHRTLEPTGCEPKPGNIYLSIF